MKNSAVTKDIIKKAALEFFFGKEVKGIIINNRSIAKRLNNFKREK